MAGDGVEGSSTRGSCSCDRKKEDEMDRRFEVMSVVMEALYQIGVVKTQLSNKVKLSIC